MIHRQPTKNGTHSTAGSDVVRSSQQAPHGNAEPQARRGLPSPGPSLPNIADNGSIRFGAAFRLINKKPG